MEKLVESCSGDRLFSRSPYKVKVREPGFRPRVPDKTRTEYFQVGSVFKQPSLSEQEWRAMEEEIKAADFILRIQNDDEAEDFVPYASETLTRAHAAATLWTLRCSPARPVPGCAGPAGWRRRRLCGRWPTGHTRAA